MAKLIFAGDDGVDIRLAGRVTNRGVNAVDRGETGKSASIRNPQKVPKGLQSVRMSGRSVSASFVGFLVHANRAIRIIYH